MKLLIIIALLSIPFSSYGVITPNGKDNLTCEYNEHAFEMGDPVFFRGQLYYCAYDGGPTTVWLPKARYERGKLD